MDKIPTLIEIKYIIKKHMLTEIYIGTITNNEEKVLGKWSSFHRELSELWITPYVCTKWNVSLFYVSTHRYIIFHVMLVIGGFSPQ